MLKSNALGSFAPITLAKGILIADAAQGQRRVALRGRP